MVTTEIPRMRGLSGVSWAEPGAEETKSPTPMRKENSEKQIPGLSPNDNSGRLTEGLDIAGSGESYEIVNHGVGCAASYGWQHGACVGLYSMNSTRVRSGS